MTSPRIPDETHKAKGTYQPCRHGNPDEKPQFPDYTGDAPEGLPDEAAAEWQRIVPILSAAGMLKQTDLALLTSYCLLFGIVQRDRYNCDIKVIKELISLCNHFGMSPMARSKIKLDRPKKPEKDQSRWLKLMNTPPPPNDTPNKSSVAK